MTNPYMDLVPKIQPQEQESNPYKALVAEPGTVGADVQYERTQRAKQQFMDAMRPPPGQPVGFMTNLKAGIVDDPQTKQQIFSNALNVPPEDVGQLNGDTVYLDQDQNLKRTGGLGFSGKAGQVAAYGPEIAGGIAGTLTGNPLIGGTVGTMAGTAYKKLAANLLLDEPQTAKGNAIDIGVEGATNFLLGGGGKAFKYLHDRKALSDIAGFDKQSVIQKIEQVRKKTGIGLDVAQASGLNTLRGLRKWVSKYPGEAASIMQANKELQDGQVNQAIDRILNTLSKQSNTTHLGERGINAATAAIEAAKAQRDEVAAPLYQQAFQEAVEVNTAPVQSFIKTRMGVAKDKHLRALKRVKAAIDNDTSVEGLHHAKLALDAMMEHEPSHVIDAVARRDIAQAKDLLIKQIEQVSPAYGEAMNAFRKASEDLVNPLEDSAVGVIARIPQSKAATAAGQLFSKENADPRQVRMVKHILQKQDPQAWNDLLRLFIAKETAKAFKVSEQGEVLNMAGKFNKAIVGTDNQFQALKAALGSEQRLFFDVVDAFKDIAASPIVGSDTAMNQLMSEQMRDSAVSKLLSPRKAVMDALDKRFMDKHAKTIAIALTDPNKIKTLKELRKLSPGAERSAIIVSAVLGNTGLKPLLNNETRAPEAISR